MSDCPQVPDLSVVTPTLNRPSQLAALLEALCGQRFPRERFEVIIVNDGGMSPAARIEPFRPGLKITLLHQPTRTGCAAARQRGVAAARGRYFVFTDDDCVPCPQWLTRLEAASRRLPGAALGGTVLNGRPGRALAEASQMVVNYFTRSQNRVLAAPADQNPGTFCDHGAPLAGDVHHEPRYFPTNNLAFPADAYRAFSGLDTAWRIAGGEDRDLCHRWLAAGHRMAFVPAAVVHHCQDLNFLRFLQQHFCYGRGALCHRRKNGLPGPPAEGADIGFYARLPVLPFGRLPASVACQTAALIVISQLSTAAGYGYEWLVGSGNPVEKPEPTMSAETGEARARL